MGNSRYQTRQVLAGAYRGRDVEARALLTHTADVATSYDSAICGKVKPGHLADEFSDPDGLQVAPTCPACLRKDPRFAKGAP